MFYQVKEAKRSRIIYLNMPTRPLEGHPVMDYQPRVF